jgi:hypothetical protein
LGLGPFVSIRGGNTKRKTTARGAALAAFVAVIAAQMAGPGLLRTDPVLDEGGHCSASMRAATGRATPGPAERADPLTAWCERRLPAPFRAYAHVDESDGDGPRFVIRDNDDKFGPTSTGSPRERRPCGPPRRHHS